MRALLGRTTSAVYKRRAVRLGKTTESNKKSSEKRSAKRKARREEMGEHDAKKLQTAHRAELVSVVFNRDDTEIYGRHNQSTR
jgi:hypothetical protein